ncbi:MAG: hypothetical protein GF309_12175 [Candidatus Lokiarchaeota archaeon]|nr:hypothetical protein [Candidatus Lokiarchaeota archaeon]
MSERSLWIGVFLAVLISGVVMILSLWPRGLDSVLLNATRLVSIFLGMLGGTALGELFRIRNNQQTGQKLLDDLREECKANLEILGTGVPLRKGFWILGMRSGRAQYLPDENRHNLWEIYSRITHYNEDIENLHRAMLLNPEQEKPAGLQEEIDDLCSEIRKRIKRFLDKN